MVFNIAVFAIIFGYAGWTIVKYVKKSKQGKCAACDLNRTCGNHCEDKADQE